MILRVLGLLTANAAVAWGACEISRRLRVGVPHVDALVFLLVRLLLISSAILVAGLSHGLSALPLSLAGGIALVGLRAARAPLPSLGARFPPVGRFAWIAGGAILIRLLLQVWFFAPHLGDAVAYHLPKIAQWIRAGAFTREMGLHPHVTFPAGFELVETWWTVFLHHDLLIEMAGLEFLALAAVGAYALARFVDLPEPWAAGAALLYVLTPGLHLSATSCLNDAAAAAMVVATMALVAWRAPLGPVLMAAGLGLGIKPTYGYALPGAAALMMLVRRTPGRVSGARRLGLVCAALGLLAGGFWYGRNLAWYGNPVYPVGSPGYRQEPVAVQAGPRLRSLLENAGDLIERRIYDSGAPYGANVDDSAGWGPVAFACGLCALAAGMLEDRRLRALAAAFGLSLASSLLFIVHDPWCLKYVFFFPAVLCVATARLAWLHGACRPIVMAAAGFAFLGTFLPYDLQIQHLRVLARQSWEERTALVLAEPPITQTRVGCFGGFDARAYLLYGPDFSREVVYLRPRSTEEFLGLIQSAGLRLVYAAPASVEQAAILEESLRRRLLAPVGGRLYTVP